MNIMSTTTTMSTTMNPAAAGMSTMTTGMSPAAAAMSTMTTGMRSCGCGHEHHEHAFTAAILPNYRMTATKKSVYILENLGCANCAAKMEQKIQELPGVSAASITFATKQLRISADGQAALIPQDPEYLLLHRIRSSRRAEGYYFCRQQQN